MFGECKKSRNEHGLFTVPPLARSLGHSPHGGTPCFGITRHSWQRVDHLNIVTHVSQKLDVVINKHAATAVCRNRVKQAYDEQTYVDAPVNSTQRGFQRGSQRHLRGR